MRIASLGGRLVLVQGAGVLDVERSSDGRFSASVPDIFERWEEFAAWANNAPAATDPLEPELLGPCVPAPRQIFAVGLNYAGHAAEGGHAIPTDPAIFTKFRASLAGPRAEIPLSSDSVDWELEMVVAIGATAYQASDGDAWKHVAGITLGQDISDRSIQYWPPVPQFSLAKSFPGYGPIGPVLVTPDEFENRDAIELRSTLNGREVQVGNTDDLIFSVPELVARLSAVLPLYPGDLIFTGTMAGVGRSLTPPSYLRDGDLLVSESPEIGVMKNVCVARSNPVPFGAKVAAEVEG